MFTEIIYRPILNLTVLLYGIGGADLGIAIVLMTIAVRTLLLPLSLRTAKSQREMTKLAPLVGKIKEEHKGNTTAQSEATMKLYKEHGVNPLGGCLPLLIQLPILIGVYRVFLDIFKPETLGLLYRFVSHPATINHITLGFLDISTRSHTLSIAAGITQFIQARMATGGQQQTKQAAAMNQQMMYILPLMIVVISWNLPAGLALYWVVTTLFSIAEQLYLRR